MGSSFADWHRLREEIRAGIDLSQPDRMAALETFREGLVSTCGEEPTVSMTLGRTVRCAEDLIEVPLADYLGWVLKVRHAAVYNWQEGRFQCLASYICSSGRPSLGAASILPVWLLENGLLIRSKLSLAGLSADEAEGFLRELDTLGASVVTPITLNEGLWGFIVLGPPLVGEYDGSESLYLSLYGLSLMGSVERRRQGLPTKEELRMREEDQALKEAMELWVALRPRHSRPRLLIVDEEPEAVKALTGFFTDWGFEVSGATKEEGALKELERLSPHLLLIDFSLNWRFPKKLLEAAQAQVPDAILLGTTAVRNDAWDELVLGLGVQEIFRKPCRLAPVAKAVFEAGINLSLAGVQAISSPKERCLLVDDEAESTEALKEHLLSQGYRVWSAPTAKEALLLLAELHPQLVVLDLKLPDSDGTGLLKQIRKISPESRVIVLTAGMHEYPEEAIRVLRPEAYPSLPISMRHWFSGI